MKTKTVCQLDSQGYFVGATEADESRRPGVFLIPVDCVEVEPPAVPMGQRARWDGTAFVFEDIPVQPTPEEPPAPSQADIIAAFTAQIQQRLDRFARQRNYDDIKSAVSYVGDPDPIFSAEGQACQILRSATWRAAYAILAQVQNCTRPMPSSIADIEADLPALVWPSHRAISPPSTSAHVPVQSTPNHFNFHTEDRE